MNPMLYLLSMTCTYACFIFSIIWIKIPDGYQIARVWRNYACDQLVSCPCGIRVFTQRSELSFRCLLSMVISFILSMLYSKHCLLILPLFIAICEIWLPRLTYGAYLVLFLKPGATTSLLLPHLLYLNRIIPLQDFFAISWSHVTYNPLMP